MPILSIYRVQSVYSETRPMSTVSSQEMEWGGGEGRSSLGRQEGVPAMLSEGWRRKVEGSSDQLREVRHKVPSDNTIGGYTTSHINNYSWREPGRLSSDK